MFESNTSYVNVVSDPMQVISQWNCSICWSWSLQPSVQMNIFWLWCLKMSESRMKPRDLQFIMILFLTDDDSRWSVESSYARLQLSCSCMASCWLHNHECSTFVRICVSTPFVVCRCIFLPSSPLKVPLQKGCCQLSLWTQPEHRQPERCLSFSRICPRCSANIL